MCLIGRKMPRCAKQDGQVTSFLYNRDICLCPFRDKGQEWESEHSVVPQTLTKVRRLFSPSHYKGRAHIPVNKKVGQCLKKVFLGIKRWLDYWQMDTHIPPPHTHIHRMHMHIYTPVSYHGLTRHCQWMDDRHFLSCFPQTLKAVCYFVSSLLIQDYPKVHFNLVSPWKRSFMHIPCTPYFKVKTRGS
jgi:hypothetical protein